MCALRGWDQDRVNPVIGDPEWLGVDIPGGSEAPGRLSRFGLEPWNASYGGRPRPDSDPRVTPAELPGRTPSVRAAGVTIPVVKRLYLLRHAKSSWKDPALADHDRPLNGRGRRAAKMMCGHMRERGVDPQLVLCSTAKRARETLARIEPALGNRAVKVERQLYGASADALLERLRRLPDNLDSVLVIGHNPGLQELALELSRPADAAGELEVKFPTAALATLELPGDTWRALDRQSAELAGFVRPRDL